mmetsp:Transcript_15647/g.51108  ORF Transcript_15647/g.51108 Transcript_15647/m.51108 type:complete len:220 (+) Transcript_15647:2664-3323(+)
MSGVEGLPTSDDDPGLPRVESGAAAAALPGCGPSAVPGREAETAPRRGWTRLRPASKLPSRHSSSSRRSFSFCAAQWSASTSRLASPSSASKPRTLPPISSTACRAAPSACRAAAASAAASAVRALASAASTLRSSAPRATDCASTRSVSNRLACSRISVNRWLRSRASCEACRWRSRASFPATEGAASARIWSTSRVAAAAAPSTASVSSASICVSSP